jgi:hypothetical protein
MTADLPAKPESPTPEARERLPYVAPSLKWLGSVRELTLGTSNKRAEGGLRNGM